MTTLSEALARLDRREQQTAALAKLGHVALTSHNLQSLFNQAVKQVARTLGNEMAKVLKLLPGGDELLLVSGTGWRRGLVGKATVGAGTDSQAGFTLQSLFPVIVEDLPAETRFSGPNLLIEHGVISGLSVIIGPGSAPWGVFGTHSTRNAIFTVEDANFVQAVANILWDAIERKRTEDALREADKRKNEFLATLGHELRNPLASISTALEITRLTDDSDTLHKSRAIVERQVDHLSRLVDDLLDVSRITRGDLQLKRKRIALADVINSTVVDCQYLIDDAGHNLDVSVPEEPVIVDADPMRLGQAFSNILSNAAKYTPRGGHITISAELDEHHVRISFRDNGVGIPSAETGRIFDMFERLDRSLETGTKGLGIGLSLVKTLVELHDGAIAALSRGADMGTEFIVTLPVAARSLLDQPDRATKKTTPNAAKCRVLVVEDNRDAADSLAKLLELLGHTTRVAYDGQEGFKAADEFRPQLILLDLGLPKLNGYDLARYIRQQAWSDDVFLAAVTGWGQESDHLRAAEAGFDKHLTKPLTLPVLTSVLAEIDNRKSMQAG